jgi:hypothetical protein
MADPKRKLALCPDVFEYNTYNDEYRDYAEEFHKRNREYARRYASRGLYDDYHHTHALDAEYSDNTSDRTSDRASNPSDGRSSGASTPIISAPPSQHSSYNIKHVNRKCDCAQCDVAECMICMGDICIKCTKPIFRDIYECGCGGIAWIRGVYGNVSEIAREAARAIDYYQHALNIANYQAQKGACENKGVGDNKSKATTNPLCYR